jgi:hypothetical protein
MRNFSRRVLRRLELAEASEPNPHLQCDIRIAWIIVLNAARGCLSPHVSAWYAVLGLHPDRTWAAICARRRAMLGTHYEQFFAESAGASLPPKKPSRSASAAEWKSRRAA